MPAWCPANEPSHLVIFPRINVCNRPGWMKNNLHTWKLPHKQYQLNGGLNINTSLDRNPVSLEKSPDSIERILNVFVLNSKNFTAGLKPHCFVFLISVVTSQCPGGCGFMKYKNSEQNLRGDLICRNKSVSLRETQRQIFFLAVSADAPKIIFFDFV